MSDSPLFNPVFYRTYSRRTDEGREHYSDMVRRVMNGLKDVANLTEEELSTIYLHLLDRKGFCSGRWSWVGGTEWRNKPQNVPGAYNCFQKDTEILTHKGIMTIESTLGDHVKVLNGNQKWSDVQFQSYGQQEIWELVVKRGHSAGLIKTIQVTGNHDWILENGDKVNTSDLVSGNYLKYSTASRPEYDDLDADDHLIYRLGITHGVIYGDGSIRGTSKRSDRENFKVRLCGEKKELLPYLICDRVLYCPSYKGDPLAMINSKDFKGFTDQGNLKKLPETDCHLYLLGFLRGLIATDGCVSRQTSPIITISGSKETVDYLEAISPVLGVEINSNKLFYAKGTKNNFGVRKKDLHLLTFYPGSLTAADFLRTSQRQTFGVGRSTKNFWKVLDVTPLGYSEEVFCCEEPITHSFTLAGGLLTGNCVSREIRTFDDMAILMDLAMQGCGTGAVLETVNVDKLPKIQTEVYVNTLDNIGKEYKSEIDEPDTAVSISTYNRIISYRIQVGDSRRGWTEAYKALLDIATKTHEQYQQVVVDVDFAYVRPKGTPLKGFGGVANPEKLPQLFIRMANILNKAVGRKLTPVEACTLIDEAAMVVVAGNIRRSAGMRQFSSSDKKAAIAKDNLWMQDEQGNWKIDPDRDALRMANHTRVFHHKPSLQECIDAVTKQYHSGEGAIMWAGEAVSRANADLLNTPERKKKFLGLYSDDVDSGKQYLSELMDIKNKQWPDIARELKHRVARYGTNPCLSGDTLVQTRNGHFPIEQLVGKAVEIWNGRRWTTIDNFRVTGENQPLLKLTLQSGQEIKATPYHKFILEDGRRVQLKDIEIGDRLQTSNIVSHGDITAKGAYLKGFLMGDGAHHQDKPICKVYKPKLVCVDRLLTSMAEIDVENYVIPPGGYIPIQKPGITDTGMLQGLSARKRELLPWVTEYRKQLPREVFTWDLHSKLEFIAGYMDADGTASDTKNGFMYQITSVEDKALRDFQILLSTVGIYSRLKLSKKAAVKDFGKRGGKCKVKPLWRIVISQICSVKLSNLTSFDRLTSFANKKVSYNIKPHWNKVTAIEDAGVASKVYCCTEPENHLFSLSIGLNTAQCGEILGNDFFCNLSEVHLNQLNPFNYTEQEYAFHAAALAAVPLLHDKFQDERFQYSRELDPIVGVSFTGLFDFFVKAFGHKWVEWCIDGRPDTEYGKVCRGVEKEYLESWRQIVEETVQNYCRENGLKAPNRCTTIQPAGTKSCLTGASSGWHPPKASRYIRRITFGKNDPVALACIEYGYNVTPSQSDKDADGKLLDDPFCDECSEWLVEVPIEKSWANLTGIDGLDVSQIPALAQFDLWLQCQQHYAGHTVSATIELREDEIVPLATRIYNAIQNDEGYVGVALLARHDASETFPRMPFEPISKVTYDRLQAEVLERRKSDNFLELLNKYDTELQEFEGPAGCSSDFCESKDKKLAQQLNKIAFPEA